jgi:predicted enzyme related to lactoylglutathione lyase
MAIETRLAQLVIGAEDLAQSRRFYLEVMGLQHIFDGPQVAAFALGGVRLLLTTRPGFKAPEQQGVIPYLSCIGIEKRHAELLAAGAPDAGKPHRIAELGEIEVWIAFVRDPSGNMIGLIEERRRQRAR